MFPKLKISGTEQSQDVVPEHVDDSVEVLASIAEEMIRAMTDRDAHRLAEALSDFWGAIQEADETEDQY